LKTKLEAELLNNFFLFQPIIQHFLYIVFIMTDVSSENLAIFMEMFPDKKADEITAAIKKMTRPSPRLEFQMEFLLVHFCTEEKKAEPVAAAATVPVIIKPFSEPIAKPKVIPFSASGLEWKKRKAKEVEEKVESEEFDEEVVEESDYSSMDDEVEKEEIDPFGCDEEEELFEAEEIEIEESKDVEMKDVEAVDDLKITLPPKTAKKTIDIKTLLKQMVTSKPSAKRSKTELINLKAEQDKLDAITRASIENAKLAIKVRCKSEHVDGSPVQYLAAYQIMEASRDRKRCVAVWTRDTGSLDYLQVDKFSGLTNRVNQDKQIIAPFTMEMVFCYDINQFPGSTDNLFGERIRIASCRDLLNPELSPYELKTFCAPQHMLLLHQIRVCSHYDPALDVVQSDYLPVKVATSIPVRTLLGKKNDYDYHRYTEGSLYTACVCQNHTELIPESKTSIYKYQMVPFVPLAGRISEVIAVTAIKRYIVKFRMQVGIHVNYFTREKFGKQLIHRLLAIQHGMKLYRTPALIRSPKTDDGELKPGTWKWSETNPVELIDLEAYHSEAFQWGANEAKEEVAIADLMEFGRQNPLIKHLEYDRFDLKDMKALTAEVGIPESSGIELLPYQAELLRYMLFQESQPLPLFDQLFLLGRTFDPAISELKDGDYPDVNYKQGKYLPARIRTNFSVPMLYENEVDKKISSTIVDPTSEAKKVATKTKETKVAVESDEDEESERDSGDEDSEDDKPKLSARELKALKDLESDALNLGKKAEKDTYKQKLTELERMRKGGVIAAEMRLGKTIMTISLIKYQKKLALERGEQVQATLIIAPINVIMKSWVKACKELAPDLKVLLLADTKLRAKYHQRADLLEKEKFDIVLCATSNLGLFESGSAILKYKYERICVDEAHMFPKPDTIRFFALTEIPSKFAWLLTGKFQSDDLITKELLSKFNANPL
jgi:hypothetical protein